jgi:hypothetical protein
MTRRPQRIGDILSELMARQGFARVQSGAALADAWQQAAGTLEIGPMVADQTRVGALRRGTLEVLVGNSALVQELGFVKQSLLKSLAQLLPDLKIKDIRFRVETIR